jgi:hypothetical protein
LRVTRGVLKDHLLTVDVFNCVRILLVCFRELVHGLLLHKVFDELLREGELPRVLVILLSKVFKEHLAVLIIELVKVNHHLLVLLAFTAVFILLVLLLLMLLVPRSFLLLLLLQLHELLGYVNIELLFLLVLILPVMMMLHHLCLLLREQVGRVATLLLLLFHHLLDLHAL